MIPVFAKPFTYQINWRSRNYHAGYHRGLEAGVGIEFRDNVPLVNHPDARRIDVSQTIRDPYEQVFVRVFNQKNPAPVFAACDLSGSMRFSGSCSKIALAAEIAASIAYSAHQSTDHFGFVGFDKIVREDWLTPLSCKMHDAYQLTQRLVEYRPTSNGADGLLSLSRYLGSARALVFLISDFHMSLSVLERALNTLSRHHVVPVVLWDSWEWRQLPRFGLSTIIDPETGEQRTLFFRKELRRKFAEAFAARREQLNTLFMRYEMPPHYVEDRFEAEAFSEYFHRYSAL